MNYKGKTPFRELVLKNEHKHMQEKVGNKFIKAWAFLAKNRVGKYFITDENDIAEIYLKKPKQIHNPFDYVGGMDKWKPTEIRITIIK